MTGSSTSMSNLKRRLVAGFGANTFSRLSTTLTQILSVPVFLTHWGAHLYGEWILLNAIPVYFGLSDVGFGSVAGNEMTMLAAAGNLAEALVVFQSVWVLTTVISSLVAFLLMGAIWFVPFDRWLQVNALSTTRCPADHPPAGPRHSAGHAGDPLSSGLSLRGEISAGNDGQESGGARRVPEHHDRSVFRAVSGAGCACCMP